MEESPPAGLPEHADDLPAARFEVWAAVESVPTCLGVYYEARDALDRASHTPGALVVSSRRAWLGEPLPEHVVLAACQDTLASAFGVPVHIADSFTKTVGRAVETSEADELRNRASYLRAALPDEVVGVFERLRALGASETDIHLLDRAIGRAFWNLNPVKP